MSRITITDTIRRELNALHRSTGVGPQRLLKGKSDRPGGLSSTTIYHWMDGKTKTAKQIHLDYVMNAWGNTSPLEVFTDADLELLNQELKRTAYTPSSLLRRLSPVPEGLTPDILHRLKSARLKKLPLAHKEFLFEALRNLTTSV